jgi:hypothetical protein
MKVDYAPIPVGTKVDVYWNLHKNVFSVRSREGETRGRVIGHVHAFTLNDVEYVVSKAGREKVLRERRKNVHAFVRGCWAELDSEHQFTGNVWRVRYDPYDEWGSFTRVLTLGGQLPIRRSEMASGSTLFKRPILFGFFS